MPELPEVETVRRGLAPVMEQKRFKSVECRRKDLRFPFPADFSKRLTGARVERLERRAKFLVLPLSSGETLTMHLGMTGRFSILGEGIGEFAHTTGGDPKHDHVVFTMEDDVQIIFNDPRRFGFMELLEEGEAATHTRFNALGPEPLSNAFSGRALYDAIHKRKSPIKALLLDQAVVAGLGNIYVCEALFRSGIHPARTGASVSLKQAEALATNIRIVLEEAILAGGSSISDFADTDGKLGYFQHTFAVYGRDKQDCQKCGHTIEKLVQSGRSSFFCAKCQK